MALIFRDAAEHHFLVSLKRQSVGVRQELSDQDIGKRKRVVRFFLALRHLGLDPDWPVLEILFFFLMAAGVGLRS